MSKSPIGDLSREATASRRGYLYQDYRVALEWLALGAEEILHVEVAEDYVKAFGDELLAAQVKDLSRSITLNDADARRALASYVELVRLNPKRSVKYAFITTAAAAVERLIEHRASSSGGISYWAEVRTGGPVAPLRKALLAMDILPELRQFINTRSDAELVRDLVMKVEWLVGESSIDQLHDQLSNKLAQRLLSDHGIPRPDGRTYVGRVMLEVQRVAQLPRNDRRLDQAGMITLLEAIATKTIGIKEYRELTVKAAIAGNLPVDVLNERIEGRLLAFQSSRNFVGYDKVSIATGLSADVRIGGQYAGASAVVRAKAMAWAARTLVDDQPDIAINLIDEAKALDGGSESVRLAEALLTGVRDLSAAMAMIALLDSRESMTVRYLLQRRAAETDAAAEVAIQWFETSGLSINELDEDGQAILLSDLMNTERWDDAAAKAVDLGLDDKNHPNLLLNGALCELGKAVPEERRPEILTMPPLWDPLDFPLIDTESGLGARARAIGLFNRLFEVATILDLETVQLHAREYVLWLTLASSPDDEGAKLELESRLSGNQNWDRWIPLALSCGIPLDKVSVREKLNQRHARDGVLGFHGARALLALMLSTDPRSGQDYWPKFRAQLSPYFEESFLISIESQMYFRAGRIMEARRALEALGEGEQAERIRRHLLIVFAKASGEDVLAMRRLAFQETNSTFDLDHLIAALAAERQWAELTNYAREMFGRSKTLCNAERYVDALRKANSWDELIEFVERNPEFVQRSDVISEVCGYIALFQGRWEAVREAIESGNLSNEAVESVRPQLSILSFQWQDFNAQIDAALANQSTHSAEALLQLAAVAATLGRKSESRLLTIKSVAIAPNNPTILMSAYFQATKGMWEGEMKAGDWLKSAIDLSDDNGPLQKKSLGDLLELAPRWREQSETTWLSLQAGNIWLAAYAKLMNQQLSHVTAGMAIANRMEPDVRSRAIIPAFSGHRPRLPLTAVRRVALDPTCLMTLASMGMLTHLAQTFEKVYVPYYTGTWLFEEFQHAEFHQPRQIEDARQLLSYIAQEKIRICSPVTSEDSALSAQVGIELADLLHHAKNLQAAGQQAFVVRVSPVHLVDSLLQKEADLTTYAEVLRSLPCIADSLEVFGAISTPEKEDAQVYLRSVDSGWETDAEVLPGALLLLDDLSVNYLQHTGLLEKLVRSGFKLMVHDQLREQAKNYESVRESRLQLYGVLSTVREFLGSGVREGGVEVLPAPRARWGHNQEKPTPAIDLFELAGDFDAIIVDDRFFNKYVYLEREGGLRVGVHCSLDVIDLLLDSRKITERQWLSCRSDLRRGGYALIPVSEKEIELAAAATQVRSGKVVENTDLRAIRENLALVQMREILQLPLESIWLTELIDSCKSFLETLLRTPFDDRVAGFFAWTLELADLRNFGSKFKGDISRDRWRALGLIPVVRFLMDCMFSEPTDEQRSRLSSEVFDPLAWLDPLAHSWLRDQAVHALLNMTYKLGSATADKTENDFIKILISRAINQLPASLRKQVLEDRKFIEDLGLSTQSEIVLDILDSPRFDWGTIWDAMAKVMYVTKPVIVRDTAGKPWELDRDNKGRVVIRLDGDSRPLLFQDIGYMAPQVQVRLAYFEEKCRDAGIDAAALPEVAALLRQNPLSPKELEEVQGLFEQFPIPLYERLCVSLSSGKSTFNDLFPDQVRYYQKLIGVWRGEANISDFAANRPGWSQAEFNFDIRLKLDLLLSGHSSTVPTARVVLADGSALKEFIDSNAEILDIWSLTGLLEALLSRKDAINYFSDQLLRLLNVFSSAIDLNEGRLGLAIALYKVSDNRIRAITMDEQVPPYWRRLAAISHAALIEQCLLNVRITDKSFVERMELLEGTYNAASIVDMRSEPRWAPFLMKSSQLQQELLGRVLNAWSIHIETSSLFEILRDKFEPLIGSMISRRNIIFASIPGPLEGNVDLSELPHALSEDLEALLQDDSKSSVELWPLVATAGFAARLRPEIQRALLSQLENTGRRAFFGSNEQKISEVLVRLGYLAATSRDTLLAKAVVNLSRQLSPCKDTGISAAICLLVSVVSIASYSESQDWKNQLVFCVNYASNTCQDKMDANQCLSLIEGFISADWSLDLLLASARVTLGTVFRRP